MRGGVEYKHEAGPIYDLSENSARGTRPARNTSLRCSGGVLMGPKPICDRYCISHTISLIDGTVSRVPIAYAPYSCRSEKTDPFNGRFLSRLAFGRLRHAEPYDGSGSYFAHS